MVYWFHFYANYTKKDSGLQVFSHNYQIVVFMGGVTIFFNFARIWQIEYIDAVGIVKHLQKFVFDMTFLLFFASSTVSWTFVPFNCFSLWYNLLSRCPYMLWKYMDAGQKIKSFRFEMIIGFSIMPFARIQATSCCRLQDLSF